MNRSQKVELLAPAGDFEKLELAVHYGADAVYLSGKDFSLRNFSGNFSPDEMRDAIRFSHANGVKVYVACNLFPQNDEIDAIRDFLSILGRLNPDGVILADPGIIRMARQMIPAVPIHLSTQANTTSVESVKFWRDAGVKRINIARETPLSHIREMAALEDVEIEAFVHGAMCIAYSGRCLLSRYMTGRSGNRGMCAHPCRYHYAVVEEKRPGHYMPVSEDDRGTYIFSAKDLCMIDHLPEFIDAGAASLKIEGRTKGIHYVATVVHVYRLAVDAYYANPSAYCVKDEWIESLKGINSRGFSTGCYLNEPDRDLCCYTPGDDFPDPPFLGKILGTAKNGFLVDVRNKFEAGQAVSILQQRRVGTRDVVMGIYDSYGVSIPAAKPGSHVTVALKHKYGKNDIIRRRN